MKKAKGKQASWSDLQVLGSVQAIINLPDASVNGAKKKRVDWHAQLKSEYYMNGNRLRVKYTSLSALKEWDTWTPQSGKIIAKNGAAAISAFRKLHNKLTTFSATKFTGNTNDEDVMRCATGLYNKTIKLSHIYDVLSFLS